MTLVLLAGSLLITFSPALALFILIITRSSQLVILSLGSAFFWLISILLTSIFWYIIPPLKTTYAFIIPFSVLFQEVFRWLFWLIYDKAYNRGALANDPSKPSNFLASLAIGWGIGTASALILFASVVWHGSGPGFLPAPACPSLSLFYLSALTALLFTLLHMALSVLAFDAYTRRVWWRVAFVVLAHLTASYLTLLNEAGGSCYAALFSILGVVLVTAVILWRTVVTENTLLRYKKLN
jgi:anterior pharynx defective protein 1